MTRKTAKSVAPEPQEIKKHLVCDLTNPESKKKYPKGFIINKTQLGEERYKLLCDKFDLSPDFEFACTPLIAKQRNTENYVKNHVSNFGLTVGYGRLRSSYLPNSNYIDVNLFIIRQYMQTISIEEMKQNKVLKLTETVNDVAYIVTNVFFEGIDYNKHLRKDALRYLKPMHNRSNWFYVAGKDWLVTNAQDMNYVQALVDCKESILLIPEIDPIAAYKKFFCSSTLDQLKNLIKTKQRIHSELMLVTSEIAIRQKRIDALNLSADTIMQDVIKELNTLNVFRVEFLKDGFYITTKDLFFTVNNKKMFAGQYQIKISYDMAIKIRLIKAHYRQPLHIHQSQYGSSVCLGTYYDALTKSASEMDYIGLVANTIEFLQTANPDDYSYKSNIDHYKTTVPEKSLLKETNFVNIFNMDYSNVSISIEDESTSPDFDVQFPHTKIAVFEETAVAESLIKNYDEEDSSEDDDETEDEEDDEEDDKEDTLQRRRGRGRPIGSRVRS